MKLRHLLKGIPGMSVRGSQEIEMSGITAHAQSVAPGNLFVAKGRGVTFIPAAVAAGATAILTDVYDPYLHGVVQLIHPDVSGVESILGHRFFRSPSQDLFLVGITGTNGKTTTSYLIRHVFQVGGIEMGLMGSIERRVRDKVLPAPINTPDLLTTLKLLREMVECGLQAATMEVSSHGLVQKRVEGIAFSVALFTNLTQDHLDYHKTMEAYAEAKARLFAGALQWAIVNADDPASSIMLAPCSAEVITYGIEGGELRATDVVLTATGIRCTVTYKNRQEPLTTSLIGRFNVYNCLAAIGVGLAYGFDLNMCCTALSSFVSVPGRMERVPNEKGVHVFVDYSHTEDSLKNALSTLRALCTGRIFTVFGCGGDRDSDKRPKMGRIAEELSDYIVITSDNPRSEDPQAILRAICSGLTRPENAHVEVGRKEAIHYALNGAQAGDIVLIAGKGHETYQIFAHETVPFDDRLVVREIFQNA